MRLSFIVVCGQPDFTIFFTFSHKRHVFRRMLLNIQCVICSPLQHSSEKFFILRRTERDMIKNIICSSCKITVILLRV